MKTLRMGSVARMKLGWKEIDFALGFLSDAPLRYVERVYYATMGTRAQRLRKARRPRAVLFLDMDGVMNDHAYDNGARSSTVRPDCVERLNRVLAVTRCAVVISSAWRYMIHGGAMTLSGFEYLLRTHGVRCPGRVIGYTEKDGPRGAHADYDERGRQCLAWLAKHGPFERYAVVDDMQAGFEGMPIVRTNGQIGLTDEDADKLIELLGKVE
jgi:hypothetical protein